MNELARMVRDAIRTIVLDRLRSIAESAQISGEERMIHTALSVVMDLPASLELAGYSSVTDVAAEWQSLRTKEDISPLMLLSDITRDIRFALGKEIYAAAIEEMATAMEVFVISPKSNYSVADSEIVSRALSANDWKEIFTANPWFFTLVLLQNASFSPSELANIGLTLSEGKE